MEQKIRGQIAKGVGAETGAEWDEIGRRIEFQVKAGLGKWAGTAPEDDWATIGDKIGAKIQKILEDALKTREATKEEGSGTPKSARSQKEEN
ncbi:MAG: hypothetical protein N2V77_02505 [Canidatus Methanoxibalbensis ujae]|nr:hypothetical protein [Candidatus Methanoxibalbensis ujae]